VLTVGGIWLVREAGYSEGWRIAAAAAALMLSLATASVLKSRLLARVLGEPINNFRKALAWALVPAVAVGAAARAFLPEWAEIAIGIPAILGIYVWMLWHKGFGPEDRVLFRKEVAA